MRFSASTPPMALILGMAFACLAPGCGHGRQFLYPKSPQRAARVVPGIRSWPIRAGDRPRKVGDKGGIFGARKPRDPGEGIGGVRAS